MPSPGHWTGQAACRGLAPVHPSSDGDDLFFSPANEDTNNAIVSMCYRCPVKLQCRMEGYAEMDGRWGNTSADWRKRQRVAIFGRLCGKMTVASEEPGFEWWMREVRELVLLVASHPSGDMRQAMKDCGFNEKEITMFLKDTAWDADAERAAARRELWVGV
ncbi:MAG: WhiB family transcriptional regulator [Burkholderiales bacterium]